jgi:hypothetical protein
MSHQLHHGDLPEGLAFGSAVAIDTEAMGLNPHRDRLCLVQLSAGDGNAHLVQFSPDNYEAPRLKRLLADPAVLKLFHFGRFDLAMLYHYLGVMPGPVYCTKIASRLARTFTDRHGLRDLCKDLLGVELSMRCWPGRTASSWPGLASISCQIVRCLTSRAGPSKTFSRIDDEPAGGPRLRAVIAIRGTVLWGIE